MRDLGFAYQRVGSPIAESRKVEPGDPQAAPGVAATGRPGGGPRDARVVLRPHAGAARRWVSRRSAAATAAGSSRPAAVDADWICYCGGVGEDITFDLGLIERFGCTVYAFDPTPRAVALRRRPSPPTSRGSASCPSASGRRTRRCGSSRRANPAHVSHSVVNLQRTKTYFEAPCRSLPTPDAASSATSGSTSSSWTSKAPSTGWYGRCSRAGSDPTVVCMEIDQPVKPLAFWRTVRRIRRAGYDLVAVDSWNLTFLRRTFVEARPASAE